MRYMRGYVQDGITEVGIHMQCTPVGTESRVTTPCIVGAEIKQKSYDRTSLRYSLQGV